jgi:site-specific DNA-cytosine methylase
LISSVVLVALALVTAEWDSRLLAWILIHSRIIRSRSFQADALTLDPGFIASFDAVHASPPCQAYSDLAKRNRNAHQWPRLIEPIREALIRSRLPYVIENVDGAPLLNPVVLCGMMFPKLGLTSL